MKPRFPVEHVIIEEKKEVWFKGSSTLAMGMKTIISKYFPGYRGCLCSHEHFNDLAKIHGIAK